MNYVLTENGNIKIGTNGHPLVLGDDEKEFEVGVYLGKELVAKGTGTSKHEAQVAAAEAGINEKSW